MLRDGDEVGFRVVATPGHAADHVSLLAGGVLFCGDTVLGEGSVFILRAAARWPPTSTRCDACSSSRWRRCAPGTDRSCDPASKLHEYLEHRLDRERRLRAALARGLRSSAEILDDVWDDVPAALRPAAALTLESHLEKLEHEGRLPDGVERLPGLEA